MKKSNNGIDMKNLKNATIQTINVGKSAGSVHVSWDLATVAPSARPKRKHHVIVKKNDIKEAAKTLEALAKIMCENTETEKVNVYAHYEQLERNAEYPDGDPEFTVAEKHETFEIGEGEWFSTVEDYVDAVRMWMWHGIWDRVTVWIHKKNGDVVDDLLIERGPNGTSTVYSKSGKYDV